MATAAINLRWFWFGLKFQLVGNPLKVEGNNPLERFKRYFIWVFRIVRRWYSYSLYNLISGLIFFLKAATAWLINKMPK